MVISILMGKNQHKTILSLHILLAKAKKCSKKKCLFCIAPLNTRLPVEDVNLSAMDTMLNAFKLPVGYSDHTKGIAIPIAAVARGARIIETFHS